MQMAVIIRIIMIIVGLYLIFDTVRMRKNGTLSKVFFNEKDIPNCKDVTGCINYLYGKSIIMSAIFVVLGLAGIYVEYFLNSKILSLVDFVLIFIWLIVYAVIFKKMRTLFFS